MANLIIVILLSTLYAVMCICCFIEFQRRACRKSKAVYLPKHLFWIGLLAGGLFTVLTWLAAKQDGSIGLTVCFGCFVLLGILLMLGWKNCFITYDKEGFTQKKLIGTQHRFTYGQVNAWCRNKQNPTESTLYADGKKISFNLVSANGADFLTAVSAGYRQTHGKKMPEAPDLSKERGGFRAHVYNPGEYLAVFLMILVFILGFGAWALIDGLQPITEKDGEPYSLTFSSWEIQEDSLVLASAQMREPFIVRGYKDYLSNFGQLTEKCNGSDVFSVWAAHVDPDDADPYFRVYALSSGKEVYRTFEDSTAYKRADLRFFAALFGIILAVFLAFSAFIYIVGSNPQKFPKWVVYCCFKKDAIEI